MLRSMRRPALFVVCAIALLHAAAYIVHEQPDWDAVWTDQGGYQRLGEVLASSGRFTRYPDSPTFVPEVIRTPGYPAFVALIYKIAGVSHMAVAVAQAFVFAAIALLVFLIVRRVTTEPVAVGAALLTALYSPLPYFGALVLTELWAAFMATAALLMCLRAVQTGKMRDFALAGALLSATTLVRPAFVLLPFFLAIAMPLLVRSQRRPAGLARWGVLAVAAALTLAPWFAYNYVYLGQFTLSPAGGVGRGLWEGAWQGHWAGRVQSDLTALAGQPLDRAQLDARVREFARQTGNAPEPMLEYVHQWRDIRAIWESPTDPIERARSRVIADREYLAAALRHIREDPVSHLIRRVTRGTFVLWAAEVPIRYSLINETPAIVIRAIWLLQVVLLALAAAGAISLARRGLRMEAVLLTLPLIYVTGVHLPLLCEARQSLPVKPVVLALAAIALARNHQILKSAR